MVTHRPALGIAVRRGPATAVLEQARIAKAAGLDSVWIADHITGFPPDAPVFEPFTALAVMGREAPGLRLGIAATDPFRRHPAVLAQSAMTVQAFCETPLLIGIGVGEAMNLDPYGIEHGRALSRLRESIEATRALSRSSLEHPVDYDGDHIRLRRAYLQQPDPPPVPQLLLAANGPRGRRLAARVADGWLSIMQTPRLLAEDLGEIRRWAEEAGRDPETLQVVCHVWLGVADNKAAGLRMIADGVKSVLLGFPKLAARLGAEIPDTFDWQALEVDHDVAERIRVSARDLPDTLVRDVAVYGSPADCAAAVEAFAAAGATHLIFRTINPMDELRDALSQVVSCLDGPRERN